MATQIKTKWIQDAAITAAKLNSSVAGNGILGGDGTALSVNVDSTSLEVSSDIVQIKDLGVSTAKIANLAVTTAKLDATSVTAAKLGSDVAGNGLTGGNGSAVTVQADGTSLSVGGSGVKVTDGGIDPAHLSSAIAGDGLSGGMGFPLSVNVDGTTLSITGDTLQVNDIYLKNNADDTCSGKIKASGFDANNNKITGVADGSDNNDAVNFYQLNAVAVAGRLWKEALLYEGQLADGSSGGIYGANVMTLTANLQSGDIISLHDGVIREDYTAGTSFVVGGSINDTLSNLSSAINGGAIAVSATTDLLDTVDASNDVLIVWQDTIGEPTRIFGDSSAASRAQILSTSSLYTGISSDLVTLPSSDPAATNFGFSRDRTSLVIAETHLARVNDSVYTWDGDSSTWQMSGASSIPYASKIMWGKVKIADGISVASGVIAVEPDAVGGSFLAKSINVTSNGVAVKVDSTTIEEGGSGRLQVKDSGISTAKIANDAVDKDKINADVAGNGLGQNVDGSLEVNVDSTTIEISSDILRVKDKGITAAKLGADVAGGGLTGGDGSAISIAAGGVGSIHINSEIAGDGLSGGDGIALSVNVDGTTIEINSDTLRVKDAGISFAKLKTDSTSALEDAGSGVIRVKVKPSGGVLIDSTGLYIDAGQISAFKMEEHTITGDETTNKAFVLSGTPADTNQVALTMLGGVAQNNGTDYSVSDTTVSWNGLGLDGWVEVGDIAQVMYPV